jgi:hypothetical protein
VGKFSKLQFIGYIYLSLSVSAIFHFTIGNIYIYIFIYLYLNFLEPSHIVYSLLNVTYKASRLSCLCAHMDKMYIEFKPVKTTCLTRSFHFSCSELCFSSASGMYKIVRPAVGESLRYK